MHIWNQLIVEKWIEKCQTVVHSTKKNGRKQQIFWIKSKLIWIIAIAIEKQVICIKYYCGRCDKHCFIRYSISRGWIFCSLRRRCSPASSTYAKWISAATVAAMRVCFEKHCKSSCCEMILMNSKLCIDGNLMLK